MLRALITSQSSWAKDVGLLIIRAGIGAVFVKHGIGKLLGGPAKWIWLGQQLAVFGINFLPIFWGVCAAGTEFFGGAALVLGFYTRVAALLLSLVMAVATMYHLQNGDPFTVVSHPISLLIVFIGLIIAGSGSFSVDRFLHR